jgi:hypothetical protein
MRRSNAYIISCLMSIAEFGSDALVVITSYANAYNMHKTTQ